MANDAAPPAAGAADDGRAPRPGRYRHYKGNFYTVIGVARHSETGEELVVYRPEYGARELWVRPRAMFTGTVCIDGTEQPRFAAVAATGPEPTRPYPGLGKRPADRDPQAV